MTETGDYIEESEDYAERGGETPETGLDILGDEGALVMAIPATNYPAGKTATARDADLTAGNIKDGVTIFGKLGTHAPEDGDNILGDEGALVMAIPATNYPAGKTATARDADLTAGNIKNGVTIFGVTGTLEGTDQYIGTFYPLSLSDDGVITSGSLVLGTLWLCMGKDTGGNPRHFFVRFPYVPIAAGSTITEAYTKLTVYDTQAVAVCNANCYFNDADNPPNPANAAAFEGLDLTDPVAWSAIPAWADGDIKNTPDLKDILQDVIDRDGWAAGNALMLVVRDNGSNTAARRAGSGFMHSNANERAELHVTWTE